MSVNGCSLRVSQLRNTLRLAVSAAAMRQTAITEYGEAIDVTDWRDGNWKGRTRNLVDQFKQFSNAPEALGPGDPGHPTHAHLAATGGKFNVQTGTPLAQMLGVTEGMRSSGGAADKLAMIAALPYGQEILAASKKLNVPPSLLAGLVETESSSQGQRRQ